MKQLETGPPSLFGPTLLGVKKRFPILFFTSCDMPMTFFFFDVFPDSESEGGLKREVFFLVYLPDRTAFFLRFAEGESSPSRLNDRLRSKMSDRISFLPAGDLLFYLIVAGEQRSSRVKQDDNTRFLSFPAASQSETALLSFQTTRRIRAFLEADEVPASFLASRTILL